MKKWLYNDPTTGQLIEYTNIDQFPTSCIGFIYKVTNICTNKFYIGKKVLFHNTNKVLTKKEIAEWDKPGRVPRKKKLTKESDWNTYWGSSKLIKEDMKLLGEDCFTREIIKLCNSKKQLSYYEVYWQFKLDVLTQDTYNENILGKFYRKDTEE